MKRRIALLTIIALTLFHVCAFATSFFPTTDELFGQTMPAVSFAIGQSATKSEQVDGGVIETYTNFSDRNYMQFGRYSAGTGCSVSSWNTEDGVVTIEIAKEDASITFKYDRSKNIATVYYPSTTRVEEAMDASYVETDSVFPEITNAFGVGLPSMKKIFNREADSMQQLSDRKTELEFDNITISDYNTMGRYWGTYNAVVANTSTKGAFIRSKILIDSNEVIVEYNVDTRKLKLVYPEMYSFKDNEFSESTDSDSVLPDPNTAFGVILPRIVTATWKYATNKEELPNGGYRETYVDFTEEDYNAFSQYLLDQGCSVVSYDTSGNVLTINLEKDGGEFVFTYDSGKATGTVEYLPGTRPEPEVSPSPSPTPEPTPTPIPTPKPEPTKAVVINYSESECWRTANSYLESIRWNNPESFKIYDYSATLDSSNGVYTFTVDYSAENKFGGTVRKYGFIFVDAGTNTITRAWID